MAKLKYLEELTVLESAPIVDLSFLAEMKKLSMLKIGKTKITAENKNLLKRIENVDLFMV